MYNPEEVQTTDTKCKSVGVECRDMFPDFIFESSWEVCNKVGGIYTVLSTRARTLVSVLGDNLVFIGPDVWSDKESPYFVEDSSLYADWRKAAIAEGLKVRVGRWQVPGNPVAVLVDFSQYYADKNNIYGRAWEDWGVDSLHAYGDYDEASMFSFASAKVVESMHRFVCVARGLKNVVYHANEWMTGLGMLYIRKHVPAVATIFTTHATSIGRSIAGNGKPLYDYLPAYNGDQMAGELNMESKHSVEKRAAWASDCFTTVSEITARECRQLLDKPVDVVLPNGFEDDFVPKAATFTRKRKAARKRLIDIANALTGCNYGDDVLIVSTSGRYEFRNKGIDVFIESMNRLRFDNNLSRDVIAFVEVPGWVGDAREDLKQRLQSKEQNTTPLEYPMLTHWLHNMDNDNVLNMMRHLNMQNHPTDKVKLIFMPCYLTGDDGVVNMNYYDIVLGNDLCVFPSYYEPWGYTPLESIAFKVPCVTTDLSGFGLWVNSVLDKQTAPSFVGEGWENPSSIEEGVKVIHRTDYNYSDVADAIKNTVVEYSQYNDAQQKRARKNAFDLSKKALWSEFIKYYNEAYAFALDKRNQREKHK